MNFIFNRLSFVHSGATLLAALTLGLACLFFGFNAGANNNDEHNKRAEQSEQEDARAKTKTADNDAIHLNSYGSDEALNIIKQLRRRVERMREAGASAAGITTMRRPDQNVMVQSEAGISAADIMMRRLNKNIVVQ